MKDISALLRSRKSEEFEGECHLTNEEADRIVAEIEHLCLSLSEARATGRRDGMEEATRIADGMPVYKRMGDLTPIANRPSDVAAAIRAAMEKEE